MEEETISVEFSAVTTVFNLGNFATEFYERMSKSLDQLSSNWEIIFVNDGSTDDSDRKIREICEKDNRVVLVNFSRNFGHHHAVMAGLEHSRGQKVFLIDVDLEESPEWILEFDRMLEKENLDVVYGVQEQRKGGIFEQFSGAFFYKFFNLLSDTQIPESTCIARIMNRRFVDAALKMQDKNLFFLGTFTWVGFNQKAFVVQKLYRPTASTYTLIKKINLAGNAIASFSSKPLQYIFFSGLFLSIFSAIFGFLIICKKLLFGISITGWASLFVSIWFLGGIIIMFVGVVGLYTSKIFIEIKSRPNYIVESVYRKEA